MIGLLDVNVLIALVWPNHVHHSHASDWFVANREKGWATSPVTESGFVRVSSNTRFIPTAVSPSEAIDMLHQLRSLPDHVFWEDNYSPLDLSDEQRIRVGASQLVTDRHLLSVAGSHGGCLVSLDRGLTRLAGDQTDRIVLVPV